MAKEVTYSTEVFCRTRFTAFHQWKDAPLKYKFLEFPHRHEFHVEVVIEVNDRDREVEFIELKERVTNYCAREFQIHGQSNPTPYSCEMMAMHIGLTMSDDYGYKVIRVEVSEDGENGGRVIFHDMHRVVPFPVKS